MQFDETQYGQFLTDHSRNGTFPEDKLERYAITSLPGDKEIAEHIEAIRKYWNKLSNANTRQAKTARLCKARDAELKAEYGEQMLTQKWWQEQQCDRDAKAEQAIASVTDDLRQNYGALGVVTAAVLLRFTESGNVTAAQAQKAAKQAGLAVVGDDVSLPEAEPIPQFRQLIQEMKTCGKVTVPDLVHPDSGPFRIMPHYVCERDKGKRLDLVAVQSQLEEVQNRGASPAGDAWVRALRILRTSLRSAPVSLDALTQYHLAWAVSAEPTLTRKKKVLTDLGVVDRDAGVIAALLGEQTVANAVSGLDRVRGLLSSGQLREARATAESLPADSEEAAEARALVATAQGRLDRLLSEARQATADSDEAAAESKLKDAALISADDAAALLATVPPPPPAGFRATGDGGEVKLFWRPGPGYDPGTAYEVYRSTRSAPASAGDRDRVHRGTSVSCADPDAPVARPVYYGVFAMADGRPLSRPAITSVTWLPPVTDLRSEIGSSAVELRWKSAHPDAEIRVTRSAGDDAPSVPVPVRGGRCLVTGLPEGQQQYFEVTAVYHSPRGEELRSAPAQVTVTPRADAKPVPRLRAVAFEEQGKTRVRVTWLAVDGSEVVIVRTDGKSPVPFGSVVTEDTLTRAGVPVTGKVAGTGREAGVETELPPGVHHLTAFSRGPSGIVAGRTTRVGVTDPVRNLAATAFADHAVVAWEWPPAAQLAEITWESAGEDPDLRFISLGEYRAEGGVRVPLGRGPCTVAVRTVIMIGDAKCPGAPVSTVISRSREAAVAYSVSGPPSAGPFGGRKKKVTFTASQGCTDVKVRVVARPGQVMPTRPGDGVPVLETTLTLSPGVPAEYQVSVPKSVRKPFWVRCFVVDGQATLAHPPISAQKEG